MPGELSFYIQDTSALLHDYNLVMTPRAQLIRNVNEARRQVAKRTGCIMRLVTGQSAFGASAQPGFAVPNGAQPGALPGAVSAFGSINIPAVVGAAVNSLQLIPGQERYPFQGFFNPFLQQEHQGCASIIDVASIAVNWGGAAMPSPAFLPWEFFQAYCRAYATLVTSYPYYWTVFNPGEFGEIWLFPAPSTIGVIEATVYAVPSNLNSNDDFDALPEGRRDAVKFKAAELCFRSTYRYADAQENAREFESRLGVSTVAADYGKIPQFYGAQS